MKLQNTKALVKSILEQNEAARSSDMVLYYEVCWRLNARSLEDAFGWVITHLEDLHLPPFESVRRSRQKVQAECPHLAASPEVEMFRAGNEEEYREFARN